MLGIYLKNEESDMKKTFFCAGLIAASFSLNGCNSSDTPAPPATAAINAAPVVKSEPTTPDYLLAKTMTAEPGLRELGRASVAIVGAQGVCQEPIDMLVNEVIGLENKLLDDNGIAVNSVEMLELVRGVFEGTEKPRACIALLRNYGNGVKETGRNHVQASIFLRQLFLAGVTVDKFNEDKPSVLK